jgi:hypothetical protein
MESVYVWLAVLGFNVAFAIFLFLLNRWIEQYRAEVLFDHKKELLQMYISLAQFMISRSSSGGITKLEEDVAMAQVSCEMSCVPQHQACITRSVVLSTLLKTLSCALQELLADGSVLQKQRAYEAISWWFFWVGWWVSGRRSYKSVTDMIAIIKDSIDSPSNAT